MRSNIHVRIPAERFTSEYAARQPHSRDPKAYKSRQLYTDDVLTQLSSAGSQADLITFKPIFDPRGSEWYWETDVQGYSSGQQVDRRASIGRTGRFSRSLLLAMSTLNSEEKTSSHCETWPTTVVYHSNHKKWLDGSLYPFNSTLSLAKGMKAVYVPHPIYFDHNWVKKELLSILKKQNFYAKSNERVMRSASFYSETTGTLTRQLYSERTAVNDTCITPAFLYPRLI